VKNHPKQKSGKAAGPESIPPEALNSSIEESTNLPYILFEKIWQEEDVPRDWKEGYIVKIPKNVTCSIVGIIEVSLCYLFQARC